MGIVRKMRKTQGLGLFEQRDEWSGAVKRYVLAPAGPRASLGCGAHSHWHPPAGNLVYLYLNFVFFFFNLNNGDNKIKS